MPSLIPKMRRMRNLVLRLVDSVGGGVRRRPILRSSAKTGVRCTEPILDRCFFCESCLAMCTARMFRFLKEWIDEQ
jgi:hypothetical protein